MFYKRQEFLNELRDYEAFKTQRQLHAGLPISSALKNL
jgi:hypothetical protein